MNYDFKSVMSQKTDEDLIRIVTVLREDYQPEAVVAAENEITYRKIDLQKYESLESKIEHDIEVQNGINHRIVSSWIRLIHFIVDSAAFFILSLVLSIIPGLVIKQPTINSVKITAGILMFISFLLYYIILEYKYQLTIGKLITKTKVVLKDGSRPKFSDILLRTIFRLIPVEAFSFILLKNGLHDYYSKTIVIRTN